MIVPAAVRGPRHRDLAVRVRDPLECDRRDEHAAARSRWPRTVVAVVQAVDVDEHARPELPAAVRRDVVAQRQLVAGAARVVAVGARLELRLGASRS